LVEEDLNRCPEMEKVTNSCGGGKENELRSTAAKKGKTGEGNSQFDRGRIMFEEMLCW